MEPAALAGGSVGTRLSISHLGSNEAAFYHMSCKKPRQSGTNVIYCHLLSQRNRCTLPFLIDDAIILVKQDCLVAE